MPDPNKSCICGKVKRRDELICSSCWFNIVPRSVRDLLTKFDKSTRERGRAEILRGVGNYWAKKKA